jgi:DNA mismatch endonuclease (patch repair protein)
MQANRGRDTKPELAVRRILHAAGYRFRVNLRVLRSARQTVDIAFTKYRVAILIDGCFWHGCPDHYIAPKANAEFWREKIETNRRRDIVTNVKLEEAGWIVLRYWEHQDPRCVAESIVKALLTRDSA